MTQDTERWTEERRDEIIGDTAWHIDKFCTGGGDNDFAAARAIVDGIERSEMQPLRERLQELERERDRLREAVGRLSVILGRAREIGTSSRLGTHEEFFTFCDELVGVLDAALSEQEGGEPA